MSYSSIDELLELAAGIMQLDAAEASLGKGRDWKEAKKQYEAAVEEFNSKRKAYIDSLLLKGEDWSAIPVSIAGELDGIQAEADASWHPAIQYTRENLLPFLTKEAGRSPVIRDIIRWTPAALVLVFAFAYLGIRLTSGVDISAPLETKLGLQQRAEAAEKVIRYDDWMGTHVRRGGWWKGIVLWPVEPSEAEIRGAGEFANVSLDGYDALVQKGEICGNLIGGFDNKLSKEQIRFTDDIADEVLRDDIQWKTPPMLTILEPIKAMFPCK